MKNKIISLAIMTASLFTMTGCLDMEPVSSITDKNMWESEGQFTSLCMGCTVVCVRTLSICLF